MSGYDSIITGAAIALAAKWNSGIADFLVLSTAFAGIFFLSATYRLSVGTYHGWLHSGVCSGAPRRLTKTPRTQTLSLMRICILNHIVLQYPR